MHISYNRLWKLLIDKGMNRQQLRLQAGLSTGTMAKLGKNENVTTDVLLRICTVLDCELEQIMEIVRLRKEVV